MLVNAALFFCIFNYCHMTNFLCITRVWRPEKQSSEPFDVNQRTPWFQLQNQERQFSKMRCIPCILISLSFYFATMYFTEVYTIPKSILISQSTNDPFYPLRTCPAWKYPTLYSWGFNQPWKVCWSGWHILEPAFAVVSQAIHRIMNHELLTTRKHPKAAFLFVSIIRKHQPVFIYHYLSWSNQ